MLRGSDDKAPEAPKDAEDDPIDVGAKALKEAMASDDPKKIAAAFRAMQVMCGSDDK